MALGVGVDGVEDLFLDRLDQFQTFLHQRAVLAEERLLQCRGVLLLAQDRIFEHLPRGGRQRGFLLLIVVVERFDLGEFVVHLFLIIFGHLVEILDGGIVGIDRFEDLLAVDDHVVLCVGAPSGCGQYDG